MPVTRSILHAVLLLALAAPGSAFAQDAPKKLQGKLICGSFSAQPKASPPWNEAIAVEIAHGAITVVRTDYPPPKGVAFTGAAGAVGRHPDRRRRRRGRRPGGVELRVLRQARTTSGITDLKGKLTAMKGALGYRICSMSF